MYLRRRLFQAGTLVTFFICVATAQQSSPPPLAFVFSASAGYFGPGEVNFGSASLTSGCEEPSHSYGDEFFSASKTSGPNSATASVATVVNDPTRLISAGGNDGGTLLVYALGRPGTAFHLQETWTGQASVIVSVGGLDGWSATATDLVKTATAQIGQNQTGSQQVSANDSSAVDGTTQSTSITCFGTTYTLAAGYRFGAVSSSGPDPTQEQGQVVASSVLTVSGYLVKPNQTPPTAVIDRIGQATASVPATLNGSRSFDSDGDGIIQYQWTIQNSAGGTDTLFGSTAHYTWNQAGAYQLTLTVTDGDGQTGTASTTVTVLASCPVPTGDMFVGGTLKYDIGSPEPVVAYDFTEALLPSTTSFAGAGKVREIDAQPGEDTCSFSGSQYTFHKGVTGSTFDVNSANQFIDTDGALAAAISYFQAALRSVPGGLPCTSKAFQQMQVMCPNGQWMDYGGVNQIGFTIYVNKITFFRGGVQTSKKFP
jgi:hypothetical protein